jgi:hypothetical protein
MSGNNILPIMITLAGGLGNQFFQVCAGIYIEKELNRKVIYNVSNLKKIPTQALGNYSRKLEDFDLINTNKLLKSKFSLPGNFILRIFKRLKHPESIISESGPMHRVLPLINDETLAVYGYFQDAKNVELVWTEFKKRISSSEKFNLFLNPEPTE